MMVSQHCLVFLTSIGHFYRLLSLHISFSIKHGYLVITCCSQCLIVHGVGVGWHECNRVETFHLFITKHARFSHILCHPVWKTHPVPTQMEIHVLHWGPSSSPKSLPRDTTPSVIPSSILHFHFFSFSWNSSTSILTAVRSLLQKTYFQSFLMTTALFCSIFSVKPVKTVVSWQLHYLLFTLLQSRSVPSEPVTFIIISPHSR